MKELVRTVVTGKLKRLPTLYHLKRSILYDMANLLDLAAIPVPNIFEIPHDSTNTLQDGILLEIELPPVEIPRQKHQQEQGRWKNTKYAYLQVV